MYSNNYENERLRQRYDSLPGTRVQLQDSLNDGNIPAGTKGTIARLDQDGRVVVDWDNGCSSTIDPCDDVYKRLSINDQILEAEVKKEEIIANKQRKRGRKDRDNDRRSNTERN